MLTTACYRLGCHMISGDGPCYDSLGAEALKNGPLRPFPWVQELSEREQLMQLFAL